MDAFIEQMRAYGIIELIRTGRVALTRSAADNLSKKQPARAAAA
jgi:acetolactate synthase small subunit